MPKVISNIQRLANRRNAQSSPGRATPQGRARSARNAIKHGLLSNQVVVSAGHGAERLVGRGSRPDVRLNHQLSHRPGRSGQQTRRSTRAPAQTPTHPSDLYGGSLMKKRYQTNPSGSVTVSTRPQRPGTQTYHTVLPPFPGCTRDSVSGYPPVDRSRCPF